MAAENPIDVAIEKVTAWVHNGHIQLSPLTVGVTLLVLLTPFIFLFVLALTQAPKPLPSPEGCRNVHLKGRSNLADQYSKKYSQGSKPDGNNKWKIKALFVYPIKSCKGIELNKSDIVETGLKHDRQFALAQLVTSLPTLEGKVTSEWQFITQRKNPRMALVETELWVPDPTAPGYSPQGEWVESGGCLVVRFPYTPDTDFSLQGMKDYGLILSAKLSGLSEPMVEFRIPLNPSKARIQKMKYKSEPMQIWKDTPVALNMSSEVPKDVMAKLKYTLGVGNPLALFRIDPYRYRNVYKCAPKKCEVGFQPVIGMQDSYPMHIMNLAAVHDVSSKLPKGYRPLNALRYRANVYLTGPPAFDEDDWKKARIGNTTYAISCHTTRCKLPNVDPETGIADKNEPGTTMLKYRKIDQGNANAACLGMQVVPLGDGDIKVGDEVDVLERGEHFYLKA